MPYKCVHCSHLYVDGSQEILSGCSECKSRFFFYIKEEQLKEISKDHDWSDDLSNSEKKRIEQDVREIAGMNEDVETPIFLDFESVRILRPGKYLLDLPKLFSKNKPRVYQLEDGKYIIDLVSAGHVEA